MFYVYILLSLKDAKTYTGSTNDLNRRLSQHNSGLVRATKHRLPLTLIYSEEYKTESEARLKEKYYKTCAGRKKIKKYYQRQALLKQELIYSGIV